MKGITNALNSSKSAEQIETKQYKLNIPEINSVLDSLLNSKVSFSLPSGSTKFIYEDENYIVFNKHIISKINNNIIDITLYSTNATIHTIIRNSLDYYIITENLNYSERPYLLKLVNSEIQNSISLLYGCYTKNLVCEIKNGLLYIIMDYRSLGIYHYTVNLNTMTLTHTEYSGFKILGKLKSYGTVVVKDLYIYTINSINTFNNAKVTLQYGDTGDYSLATDNIMCVEHSDCIIITGYMNGNLGVVTVLLKFTSSTNATMYKTNLTRAMSESKYLGGYYYTRTSDSSPLAWKSANGRDYTSVSIAEYPNLKYLQDNTTGHYYTYLHISGKWYKKLKLNGKSVSELEKPFMNCISNVYNYNGSNYFIGICTSEYSSGAHLVTIYNINGDIISEVFSKHLSHTNTYIFGDFIQVVLGTNNSFVIDAIKDTGYYFVLGTDNNIKANKVSYNSQYIEGIAYLLPRNTISSDVTYQNISNTFSVNKLNNSDIIMCDYITFNGDGLLTLKQFNDNYSISCLSNVCRIHIANGKKFISFGSYLILYNLDGTKLNTFGLNTGIPEDIIETVIYAEGKYWILGRKMIAVSDDGIIWNKVNATEAEYANIQQFAKIARSTSNIYKVNENAVVINDGVAYIYSGGTNVYYQQVPKDNIRYETDGVNTYIVTLKEKKLISSEILN